ncbi:MAG: DUF2865 domain-containing protein [Hyphomicrobiaceae bacterium]
MSAVSRTAAIAVLITSVVAGAAGESRAQGFFQSLFGLSGPAAPSPATRATPTVPVPQYDRGYRTPVSPPVRVQPTRGHPDHTSDEERVSLSGQFRTVCVRTCDGYYFPISTSVSRRAFNRDANLCRASCGSEARLFYSSGSTDNAAGMVDLTGRSYGQMPNAFRYRKALVDGCKCKPEPWAQSEVDRHRRYAAEEVMAKAKEAPKAEQQQAAATSTKPSAPSDSVVSGQEPKVAAETPTERTEPTTREAAASGPNAAIARASMAMPRKAAGSRHAKAAAARPETSHKQAPPATTAKVARRSTPAQPPVRTAGALKPAPAGLGGQTLKWPGDR